MKLEISFRNKCNIEKIINIIHFILFKYNKMELTITNDKNSFDPTPKLKSSPVPISFFPFSRIENKCNYCGNEYSYTKSFFQRYCKKCLSKYISQITDDNTYLDVDIVTNYVQCNKHVVARNMDFCTQNIREWCESCSDILYFRQIFTYDTFIRYIFSNDCKLCGKLMYQEVSYYVNFKICSDCYKISSEWIESTLTKKLIPILYLPWWDQYQFVVKIVIYT